MITLILHAFRDFLAPEIPEYQIQLSGFSVQQESEENQQPVLNLTFFYFSEDRQLKIQPGDYNDSPIYKNPLNLNFEVLISVQNGSHELAIDAIEKVFKKILNSGKLSTPEYEYSLSQKNLTFEETLKLFEICRLGIFPYLFLQIKALEK